MIRKLRTRFMIINMSLVSIVLLGMILANTLSTIQQVSANSYSSLNDSIRQVGAFSFDYVSPKKNMSQRAFPQDIIWLNISNSDIEIINTGTTPDYSDEYINEIVKVALEDNKEKGLLRGYDLRYEILTSKSGVKAIGFIDVSYEMSFVYNQIINYLLVAIASLAAFFVISYFLASIAIKPVEKAFNQQKQFVSDVSHELKTPISVILANTSIMKSEEVNKKSKWLNYIEKEGIRMKKLVDELLFLARMDESDKLQTQTKLNYSDTLYSCVLPFESVAFENDISMDIDITEDVFIKGNADQIKRLILILVDNACKYSSKNSAISLNLKTINNKAILTVHNFGKAIPNEDIDKVFDRFYRVDKARERKSNSYGLGLSMAEKIVKAHDGDISVVSNEVRGTTFTVTMHVVQ